ncbi:hypothetical protein LZ32DRAFT_226615 [Colletotrichum eremochloae]|nr:hypothetical protein LZ32DRAFT_226615 [Colletotrichum eremochloae]
MPRCALEMDGKYCLRLLHKLAAHSFRTPHVPPSNPDPGRLLRLHALMYGVRCLLCISVRVRREETTSTPQSRYITVVSHASLSCSSYPSRLEEGGRPSPRNKQLVGMLDPVPTHHLGHLQLRPGVFLPFSPPSSTSSYQPELLLYGMMELVLCTGRRLKVLAGHISPVLVLVLVRLCFPLCYESVSCIFYTLLLGMLFFGFQHLLPAPLPTFFLDSFRGSRDRARLAGVLSSYPGVSSGSTNDVPFRRLSGFRRADLPAKPLSIG